MPWIYYKNPAAQVIAAADRIPFEVSIDREDPINTHTLEFYLAVYSIDGVFQRMEKLTDQMIFCTKQYEDGLRYREFGTTYINDCSIDLSRYITRNYTMNFYEMFLLNNSSESSNSSLIDVPVLIANVNNPFANGKLNNQTNQENWILTRRFFLVDNLSGIQGSGNYIGNKTLPFAIRYAQSIKMNITMQNIEDPRIFPPYVEIYYEARLSDSLALDPLGSFSFRALYYMDLTNFNFSMLGVLIALCFLISIAVSCHMNVWRKTHPRIFNPVFVLIL